MGNVILKAIQRVICVNVRKVGLDQNANALTTAIILPVPTLVRVSLEKRTSFACVKKIILEKYVISLIIAKISIAHSLVYAWII